MAEEQDGETNFSPTNSLKEHLNAEQIPQNKSKSDYLCYGNYWFEAITERINEPSYSPLCMSKRPPFPLQWLALILSRFVLVKNLEIMRGQGL